MCRLAAAVALASGAWLSATAATFATYRDGDRELLLRTERCAGGTGQRAWIGPAGRIAQGCWFVDGRERVIVRWDDGRRQALEEARIRLAPAYAASLGQPAPTARATTAAATFPRAAWCPQARFAHERLICADAELAAADLALAPLWQAYARHAAPAEQARVKADYFRRLKACGARKACIAQEQAAQRRFYRQGR